MRQCDAAEKPLLLAACRLENLSFASPPILIDSLLPSKKRLARVAFRDPPLQSSAFFG